MAVAFKKDSALKVADEVFLVVAKLHQENPDAEDFSVQEILDRAQKLNLNGAMRPGFQVHVRMHCVANMAPNPGDYRMLYASSKARRRLLRKSDLVNGQRKGKMFPDLKDLNPMYFELVNWARARYEASDEAPTFLDQLLALRGSGRELWADEHADEYVARLRSDWD